MKRSEIRKAIESWFDIERYDAIEQRILAYRMLLSRNTIPTLNRLLLDD